MTPRTMSPLLAAALCLVAGCAPKTPAASSPSTTSTTASTSTPAPSATPQDGVGQKAVGFAGNRFSMSEPELNRQGTTVTLTARIRVDEARVAKPTTVDLLSDPQDAISQAKGIPNGIGLVDGRSQTLFMPATTTKSLDSAVCSPNFPTTLTTGDVWEITCTYAAVPEAVDQVTVNAPHFGSFAHVRIS